MLYLQASLEEPLVQCAMRIAIPNRRSQSRSSEPRGQPGNVGLPADRFELGSDTPDCGPSAYPTAYPFERSDDQKRRNPLRDKGFRERAQHDSNMRPSDS